MTEDISSRQGADQGPTNITKRYGLYTLRKTAQLGKYKPVILVVDPYLKVLGASASLVTHEKYV